MQKLRCDLSPASVGDPAVGTLPSSLPAPTDLSQPEKLGCYGIWMNFNDMLGGVAMQRLYRDQFSAAAEERTMSPCVQPQ